MRYSIQQLREYLRYPTFYHFYFGTKFIIAGDMSIGDMVAFSTYLGLLVWPMLAFGFLFNIVERGNASYSRITELLSIAPEIKDLPGAIDKRPEGDLQFDIEEFKFPEDERSRCTMSTLH